MDLSLPDRRGSCYACTRPVTFQLELMKKAGFRQVDILHRNTCFAAFGGIK